MVTHEEPFNKVESLGNREVNTLPLEGTSPLEPQPKYRNNHRVPVVDSTSGTFRKQPVMFYPRKVPDDGEGWNVCKPTLYTVITSNLHVWMCVCVVCVCARVRVCVCENVQVLRPKTVRTWGSETGSN